MILRCFPMFFRHFPLFLVVFPYFYHFILLLYFIIFAFPIPNRTEAPFPIMAVRRSCHFPYVTPNQLTAQLSILLTAQLSILYVPHCECYSIASDIYTHHLYIYYIPYLDYIHRMFYITIGKLRYVD